MKNPEKPEVTAVTISAKRISTMQRPSSYPALTRMPLLTIV